MLRLACCCRTDSTSSAGAPPELVESVRQQQASLKIDYIVKDLEDLVRESLEGAERVRSIVADLKSFSRVDESEYKQADLNECLRSTINIVWNEIKYKATLKKELGEIPQTRCYPQQMNQVFMNLLVNAAHAIEHQGVITVRSWEEDGYVCVTVADTGQGIPEANLNRIFEPFFTTKEVGKGTGLGLSITYDIVKKHNGEIRCGANPERGPCSQCGSPWWRRSDDGRTDPHPLRRCLLYTSDAADDLLCVDLGGRR